MSIPMICIALLALPVFLLGARITLLRATSGKYYGGAEDPESALYKVRRAHGNTIEYVPILAVLMLALAQPPQPNWVLWCMGLATFFRYSVIAGLLFPASMAKANPMRFFGALGTYITGTALVCALFLQIINA